MKAEFVTITPAMAHNMLAGNTNNRKLDIQHVNYLADQMNSGEWIVNGDAIRFNGSALLDGQHRLQAIIKHNRPVTALVVRGVSSEAFKTIDVLRKGRSMGQVLSLAGEVNTNVLSGAIRVVLDIREEGKSKRSARRVSPNELMRFIENEPGIRESVLISNRWNSTRSLIGPSIPAAMHHLFTAVDSERANEFMADLNSGLVLSDHDPIYLLRARLIANSSSRMKLDRATIMALIIKTWNARFMGTEIRTLKWSITEAFPTIMSDLD